MHALFYRQPLIRLSHFESWKIWESDDMRIKDTWYNGVSLPRKRLYSHVVRVSYFSRCKMTDKRPPVWASPWAMQQCSFFLFYPRVKTNSETTELVQSADEHSWLARVSCHSESVNVLTIFSIDSRFCRALMSSVRSCCESRWLQILHSSVYHCCCKKQFQY